MPDSTPPAPLFPDLQIYTLGDVQIELRARPVPKLTKPTKALLVYLALNPTRAFPRELLAQMLWLSTADEGDPQEEKRANDSMRKALQVLRAALGDDIFVQDQDNHTVQLNPARTVWLDARAVETAARAYLNSPRAPDALRSAESPLALFRGEFMTGYDDLPSPAWLERERARLIELENELLIAEARAAKQRGEYARALAYVERAQGRDPLNQDACAEAMWLHWRLNQPRDALRLYDDLKRALRENNDVPMSALRQLRAKIQNDLERTTRRALQLTNLPLLETSFVGRAHELQELRALLHPRGSENKRPKRLITLVGPGGGGKTRLARELAASVLKQYRDGVWWVELDALEKERGDVAQAVAQVLGVRHETERPLLDTLAAYLRDKKMLLVLDNCEHVLPTSGVVCAKLLSTCPHIQILATSREALRVTGEKQFPLTTLNTPKFQDAAIVNATTLKALAAFDAVRLFTDRARQEQEAFALTQENARDVAQLCRRLDGLPLALELAAARLNTLTLREIVDGLDERFELLKRGRRLPARHETLRAVLDWSYDLLNDDERALFALLGVFAGRFTEQAVEVVTTDDRRRATNDESPSAVRRLSSVQSLVDKSLVQQEFDADGARRYRLLETLRAYAREKLDEDSARADAAYVRMARYYLDFAKTHQQDFIGLEREWDNLSYGLSIMHWQENWQEVLDYGYALTDAAFARGLYTQARAMYPQVMEAAGHLEEQGADIQMRLKYALALTEQGYYGEAREVLERLLRISEAANDEYGIAGAHTCLARVAREQGHLDQVEEHLNNALAIWRKLNNPEGLGEALLEMAHLCYRERAYDEVEQLTADALEQFSRTRRRDAQIELWLLRATVALDRRTLDLSQEYCLKALALCEGAKYLSQHATSTYTLSQTYWHMGDLERAKTEAYAALDTFVRLGDKKQHAYVLHYLIALLADMGDYQAALRAADESAKILESLGDAWSMLYVWRDLGYVYAKMGNLRRARKIWLKSLEVIERDFPDHRVKRQVLLRLEEFFPTKEQNPPFP